MSLASLLPRAGKAVPRPTSHREIDISHHERDNGLHPHIENIHRMDARQGNSFNKPQVAPRSLRDGLSTLCNPPACEAEALHSPGKPHCDDGTFAFNVLPCHTIGSPVILKRDYLHATTPFRALVALLVDFVSQRPLGIACEAFWSQREKEGGALQWASGNGSTSVVRQERAPPLPKTQLPPTLLAPHRPQP